MSNHKYDLFVGTNYNVFSHREVKKFASFFKNLMTNSCLDLVVKDPYVTQSYSYPAMLNLTFYLDGANGALEGINTEANYWYYLYAKCHIPQIAFRITKRNGNIGGVPVNEFVYGATVDFPYSKARRYQCRTITPLLLSCYQYGDKISDLDFRDIIEGLEDVKRHPMKPSRNPFRK